MSDLEPAGPQQLLDSLRTDVDQKFFEPVWQEWVWLKAYHNSDGKRTGVTDCCTVEIPCEWHAQCERINSKGGNA